MSDYATLKADIAQEMARSDLDSQMARFQRQTTQRINRHIRVSDMERRARAFGNGTRYMPAPDGFLEMRRLWNVQLAETTNRYPYIRQVTPQYLRPVPAGGRPPSYFCTHRREPPEIEFDSVLGTSGEVEMVYMVAYPELVEDTDTNWLLANEYDIYFQAMLHAAEKYVRNDERAAARATDWIQARDELESAERRQEYAQPMNASPTQPVF